jgi:hypothetical protein
MPGNHVVDIAVLEICWRSFSRICPLEGDFLVDDGLKEILLLLNSCIQHLHACPGKSFHLLFAINRDGED